MVTNTPPNTDIEEIELQGAERGGGTGGTRIHRSARAQGLNSS